MHHHIRLCVVLCDTHCFAIDRVEHGQARSQADESAHVWGFARAKGQLNLAAASADLMLDHGMDLHVTIAQRLWRLFHNTKREVCPIWHAIAIDIGRGVNQEVVRKSDVWCWAQKLEDQRGGNKARDDHADVVLEKHQHLPGHTGRVDRAIANGGERMH
eukprot:scaffold224298_cov30-Tisochrysis_lutea.AAC.2